MQANETDKRAGSFIQGGNWDLSGVPDAILRAEWQRRMAHRRKCVGHSSGRPSIERQCPACKAWMPARKLHLHRCPARAEQFERRVVDLRVSKHLSWAHDLARQARRLLPPSVDVEDLGQIASMKLMEAAKEYSPKPAEGYTKPTPFTVFAYPYVYYGCLMAYRGRHFRDVTHEELPDVPVQADESRAERAELLDRMRSALSLLPPLQAAVVSLVYFGGRTVAEAAAECKVGKGYASQMHRAGLAAMKRVLVERGITSVGACL